MLHIRSSYVHCNVFAKHTSSSLRYDPIICMESKTYNIWLIDYILFWYSEAVIFVQYNRSDILMPNSV